MMTKFFGKPKYRWGWVRVAAYALVVVILAWAVVSAGLRGIGGVSWMQWSRYDSFSPLMALQLMVIPLVAALVTGWRSKSTRRRPS